MENSLRDNEMLDVIGKLSSHRETGRMQIQTGMTSGAVFLNKGQIVDASLGKLRGFQAINALASIRDATFTFDPSIAPPVDSSITANEQTLLNDFFGIGRLHHNADFFDDLAGPADNPPAQVVPLSEVEDHDRTNVVDAQYTRETTSHFDEAIPLAGSPFVTPEPTSLNRDDAELRTPHFAEEPLIADNREEVTLVKPKKPVREQRTALGYGPVSQRRFSPALLATVATVLAILLGTVAVAVVNRLRLRSSTTPAVVQTPANGTETPANVPESHASAPETHANVPASPAHVTETHPNISVTPADISKTPASVPEDTKSEGARTDVASGSPNLSGNWKVTNTVEQTSYQAYRNMEVGFELSINQRGSDFTGTGQKVSENGRSLQGSSRTPIVVQGTINGDKVEATFSESGATRKTNGHFVWRIDKATGKLTGTFASTAARARGRSAATKDF
jgi:hypothetical protein